MTIYISLQGYANLVPWGGGADGYPWECTRHAEGEPVTGLVRNQRRLQNVSNHSRRIRLTFYVLRSVKKLKS